MSDLIDQVIRSAVLTQYMLSKTQFDNAKDTKALITAANENADMLVRVVEHKLRQRVEQLLIEQLEQSVNAEKRLVRIGNNWYELTKVEE